MEWYYVHNEYFVERLRLKRDAVTHFLYKIQKDTKTQPMNSAQISIFHHILATFVKSKIEMIIAL